VIIVHIDFTGTYNEEMNYQENLLPRANALHGNCVYFVTTCYRWNNGLEEKVAPERITLPDGVRLVRMPYTSFGLEALNKRFRAVSGLYTLMQQIHPDVVFLHCVQTAAVYSIIKYVKKHPNVVFYADTHTDFHNSAKGFISRKLLHGILYRHFCIKIIPYVRKLFYVTDECRVFMESMYTFPSEKMEYLPLGGFLLTDDQYNERRNQVRNKFGLTTETIVFMHSGKFNAQKKTDELVQCFHQSHLENERLIIVGSFDEALEKQLTPIMKTDSNIIYLGWVNGEQLRTLLCATDVYIQPGTQSVTMQTAACCRCALALFPYESHVNLLGDAAFYLKCEADIKYFFQHVGLEIINCVRKDVYRIASSKLDYMRQAEIFEEKR